MPDRYVNLDFHIDANKINARYGLPYMNILEEWDRNSVIHMEMAEVAQAEAARSTNSNRRQKVHSYIATETLAGAPDEFRLLNQIKAVLFPQGITSQNEGNDVEIVFNAHKYDAILVTKDGYEEQIISQRRRGSLLPKRVLAQKTSRK